MIIIIQIVRGMDKKERVRQKPDYLVYRRPNTPKEEKGKIKALPSLPLLPPLHKEDEEGSPQGGWW